MKRCLLDTNAFSEILTSGPRLGRVAAEFIAGCSQVMVSAVTFYEIGQKVRLGKWPSMEPHVHVLEENAAAAGYDIMALTSSLALRAALLDWNHRDPFDRMIAALALQEGVAVVSSDAAFDAVGVERVW